MFFSNGTCSTVLQCFLGCFLSSLSFLQRYLLHSFLVGWIFFRFSSGFFCAYFKTKLFGGFVFPNVPRNGDFEKVSWRFQAMDPNSA